MSEEANKKQPAAPVDAPTLRAAMGVIPNPHRHPQDVPLPEAVNQQRPASDRIDSASSVGRGDGKDASASTGCEYEIFTQQYTEAAKDVALGRWVNFGPRDGWREGLLGGTDVYRKVGDDWFMFRLPECVNRTGTPKREWCPHGGPRCADCGIDHPVILR